MTLFTDTPHQRDDQTAPALHPFLPKRSTPNRPVSGRTYSMYRHPERLERVASKVVLAPDHNLGNSTLAFDAIYDAFQAQRTMLRAFAELRDDDGAECLW